jgi:hypothetical protein
MDFVGIQGRLEQARMGPERKFCRPPPGDVLPRSSGDSSRDAAPGESDLACDCTSCGTASVLDELVRCLIHGFSKSITRGSATWHRECDGGDRVKAAPPDHQPQRAPLVLIADDDRSRREVLLAALHLEGYREAAASNGGEALRLLTATRRGFDPVRREDACPRRLRVREGAASGE